MTGGSGGSKRDLMDMFGEHRLSFMVFTCLCFAIAIYCFKTAGASGFGDPCSYQFHCADLARFDLECRPVNHEELCVVVESPTGECPDHTRHEDGYCLPIEGIRTVDRGEDRIAPSIHGPRGPSSALGED